MEHKDLQVGMCLRRNEAPVVAENGVSERDRNRRGNQDVNGRTRPRRVMEGLLLLPRVRWETTGRF